MLISVLIIAKAVSAADDGKQTKWSTTTTFFEAAADIIYKGAALWDKLSVLQAAQIAQSAVTGAGDLRNDNDLLHNDLLQKKIGSREQLASRVSALKEKLNALNKQISDFAVEIDKASFGIGDQLRNEANNAYIGKSNQLEYLENSWDPRDPSKAIGHLDEATKNLRRYEPSRIACSKRLLQNELSATPRNYALRLNRTNSETF